MNISSVDQSYLLQLYYQSLNKTQVQGSTQATPQAEQTDTLDISAQAQQAAKMPPPPHEMDFSNMSDADLQDYLSQMYQLTGTLPGGAQGNVDNLSEDELADYRSILTEMSQNGPIAQAIGDYQIDATDTETQQALWTLYMMNMQTMAMAQNDGSEDGLYRMGGIQADSSMMLEQIIARLAETQENEESTAQQEEVQQAIDAYEQNSIII